MLLAVVRTGIMQAAGQPLADLQQRGQAALTAEHAPTETMGHDSVFCCLGSKLASCVPENLFNLQIPHPSGPLAASKCRMVSDC